LVPREELLVGDTLRIGYEDQKGHALIRVKKSVPRNGKFYLSLPAKKGPAKGTAVFLTDRREKALDQMIAGLEKELAQLPSVNIGASNFSLKLPRPKHRRGPSVRVDVYRFLKGGRRSASVGFWLSDANLKVLKRGAARNTWCWLPPVVWPQSEDAVISLVATARQKGCRQFVLNAPWQTAFFGRPKALVLWAGPFCNAASHLALQSLAEMGFNGAFLSPELGRRDYLEMPARSPIPLGMVISGHWPLCVSRIVADDVKTGKAFTSPRGEQGWTARYENDYWTFANWQLDLQSKIKGLEKAGYKQFVHLVEPLPRGVKLKKRPGKWNWGIDLK